MKLLKNKDGLTLKGSARLIVTEPKTGKVVKVIKARNLVVTVGMAFVGGMLIDKDSDHDIGLVKGAIGTNDTTPALSDTQLGTEVARKTITSRSRTGNEITCSTFFTAAESSYNLKEAGIFGSALATETANSGKLFAHWLSSFDNSAGDYDLTYEYTLIIG